MVEYFDPDLPGPVTDFEVVNLGVHHPDYFQGFGVAFTSYSNCITGIGGTLAEAFDDMLECMAQCEGVDFSGDLEERIKATFDPECPLGPVAPDGAYYHVGIRWNQ